MEERQNNRKEHSLVDKAFHFEAKQKPSKGPFFQTQLSLTISRKRSRDDLGVLVKKDSRVSQDGY